MQGLEPSSGASAVLGVATLLDRLGALENGAERKATRKADHAALALLGRRGYSKEELDRLRALVKLAQKKDPIVHDAAEVSDEQRDEALMRLRGWWVDWSTTARIVISRRDQLIRLGIASRRLRNGNDDGDAAEPVSPDGGTEPIVPNPLAPSPSASPAVQAGPAPAVAAGVNPSAPAAAIAPTVPQ